MDTLSDYIQWMGDYPCSLTGFHEPDALLLCLLSYIDFGPAAREASGSFTLRDCLPYAEKEELPVMITGDKKAYREILKLAAKSVRFGEVVLEDYQDLQREDPPLQFSAVCFQDKAFSFIAFRGTDNSIAGWKEDFMISFTETEAQKRALKYLQNTLDGERHVIVAGHSKGANLALYAATHIEDEYQKWIDYVYMNDGPGLCGKFSGLMHAFAPTTHVFRVLFQMVNSSYSLSFRSSSDVRPCLKNGQHAETAALFPPYCVKFPCNTQSIPAKICLVWRKNSSSFVILPFFKQGLVKSVRLTAYGKAALVGESAVPCNLQSAIAGVNSYTRACVVLLSG